MTDWLNAGWLTDWELTDWQNDWLTDWLTGWLTDSLTHWPTDWLTNNWMTNRMSDRPGDWLADQINEPTNGQADVSPFRKWLFIYHIWASIEIGKVGLLRERKIGELCRNPLRAEEREKLQPNSFVLRTVRATRVPTSLTCDVTFEIAENDWDRGSKPDSHKAWRPKLEPRSHRCKATAVTTTQAMLSSAMEAGFEFWHRCLSL